MARTALTPVPISLRITSASDALFDVERVSFAGFSESTPVASFELRAVMYPADALITIAFVMIGACVQGNVRAEISWSRVETRGHLFPDSPHTALDALRYAVRCYCIQVRCVRLLLIILAYFTWCQERL